MTTGGTFRDHLDAEHGGKFDARDSSSTDAHDPDAIGGALLVGGDHPASDTGVGIFLPANRLQILRVHLEQSEVVLSVVTNIPGR